MKRKMYKGSHRINLAQDHWFNDRHNRKVPVFVPLLEDSADRYRAFVWLENTIISLENELNKPTRAEREKIWAQLDALNAVRRAFCGSSEEEISNQLDHLDNGDK